MSSAILSPAPATPAWPPEGAAAYADFVNGSYGAGGVTLSFDDLVDSGTAGAGGLTSPDPYTRVTFIGPLAPLFSSTAGCTVVLEWDHLYAENFLFEVKNVEDEFFVQPEKGSGWVYAADSWGSSVEALPDPGIARVAVNIGPASYTISANGSAIDTPHAMHSPGPFGAATFRGERPLRKLIVYPLRPDADLPALSALS